MADDGIRRYTLDARRAMAVRGDTLTDRERLKREPGVELDEDFWRDARLVMPAGRGKRSIHLRVDADVLDRFKGQGPGDQTRMNAVLHTDAESRRRGGIDGFLRTDYRDNEARSGGARLCERGGNGDRPR